MLSCLGWASLAAGGARQQSRKRLKDFKAERGRIQHIRSCGLNPFEYVRTAGLPTITYGFDTNGCADTNLKHTTSAVARVLLPPTAGKDPVLAMNAVTAIYPEADPTYAAHTLPIKR